MKRISQSGLRGRVPCMAMVVAVAIAGCGGGDEGGAAADDAAAGQDRELKIAFLGYARENGFTQSAYEGVEEAAREGNAQAEFLDGQFKGDVQFNQLQDIIATGKFDGVVVTPNDGVGIATQVKAAIEEGIKVAAVNAPIGPDLVTLEPQVPGLTTTVASNQETSSKDQAELAVDLCQDKDPCRVVLFYGILKSPQDVLRRDAYKSVLQQHGNIDIVAEIEGEYSREVSLGAMQDTLQANKEVDLVLSVADQHIFGAELALDRAGIPLDPTGDDGVMLLGRGASTEAVERVRAGKWAGTYVDLPKTMARTATEMLIRELRGEGDIERVVEQSQFSPVGAIATPQSLKTASDFKGEWVG